MRYQTSRRRLRNLSLVLLLAILPVLTSCGVGTNTPGVALRRASLSTSPSGSGSPTNSRVASGTVTLPPGFGMNLASLTVTTTSGSSAVGGDGSFTVPVPNATNPVLGLVSGPSGGGCCGTPTPKVVLVGILTGGTTTATIDPNSTAVVLLYYASGAFTLPDAGSQKKALQLIAGDPSAGTLGGAVTTSILGNPTAITDGDDTLNAAVQAAQTALLGNTCGLSERPLLALLQVSGVAPSRTHYGGCAPCSSPSISICPPAPCQNHMGICMQVSGSGCKNTNGVTATNNFRRFLTQILVYKTGQSNPCVPCSSPTMLPTAIAENDGAPISLGSNLSITNLTGAAFTAINGLVRFVQGNSFVPPSNALIPASLLMASSNPGVTNLYAVVVLSPFLALSSGSPNANEPGFFSQSQFAGELSLWRQSINNLNIEEWVFDIILPYFGSIVGFTPADISPAAVTQVVQFLGQLPTVIALVSTGQVTNLVSAVSQLTNLLDGQILSQFVNILGTFAPNFTPSLASAAILLAEHSNAIINAINLSLLVIDIGRAFHDLSTTNRAGVWNVTVMSRPGQATCHTYTWSIPACFILNNSGCGFTARVHLILNFQSVLHSDGAFFGCKLLVSSKAAVVSVGGVLCKPRRCCSCCKTTFSLTPCVTDCFTSFVPNQIGLLPPGTLEGGLDLHHPCGSSKPDSIQVFLVGPAPVNVVTSCHIGPPSCPCNGSSTGSFNVGIQTCINCGAEEIPVSMPLDANFNVIGCQAGVPLFPRQVHNVFTWGSATPSICPPLK